MKARLLFSRVFDVICWTLGPCLFLPGFISYIQLSGYRREDSLAVFVIGLIFISFGALRIYWRRSQKGVAE